MAHIPTIVHICTQKLSVVLDLSFGALPRIAYWGHSLQSSTFADIYSLVAATRETPDGNQPNALESWGITPLEGDWWPGRAALRGVRANGINWSPRFELIKLKYQANNSAEPAIYSKPISSSQKAESYLEINGGTLEITAISCISHLELRYDIEVFTQGLWRIRGHLKNTASTEYHLHELGIVLPLPLEANEILDTAGRWGKERTEQRTHLNIGCWIRECNHGRTGFDAPGFTFVGTPSFDYSTGEIWGLHNAWSGNHRVWVERMLNGVQVIGASEILAPGEIILGTEESYSTPWFYACYAYGLDDAAQQVHRWYRSRKNHPHTPRPVTLNVWEAVYYDQDLEHLKTLAKTAADIGVERFVLDDGWFLGRRNDCAGLGDWYVDPEVWPDGLAPLADYVHELGMDFGLWFEPEMVNENSHLARNHPEWILASQGSSEISQLPRRWRNQQVLNLSLQPAYAYIRDRIDTLIRQYDIAFIKWDHNRDLIDAGTTAKGGAPAVHDQTLAIYRLMDELKVLHPSLEIESCSSGGGRVDFEILQHTDRFWASDCIDPVERLPMMRAYAQIAPPELLGAHVASPFSQTTGRYSPLSMRAGTAIFGSFGIEWDILSASDTERAELAQWIKFYKENRSFLHTGKVIRCATPDATLSLHAVVSADCSRAIYHLTTHDRSAISPRGKLKFTGLDPHRQYRLRPLIIGDEPKGLVKPPWFSTPEGSHSSGIVATGEVLAYAGVATPRMYPDQSLLFEATAEDC